MYRMLYITFGKGHKYQSLIVNVTGAWIGDEARAKMKQIFGRTWQYQYGESQWGDRETNKVIIVINIFTKKEDIFKKLSKY